MTPITAINTAAWIIANLEVAYISIALIVFVFGYFILFDPNSTTGGSLIFKFTASLVGVIGLIFLSLFIDPSMGRKWFSYPGDVIWWRPLLRLLVYSFVAYTITGLTVLLAYRKFAPHKTHKRPDETTLVRTRKFGKHKLPK
jgi:hypothetical protein